MEKKRLFKILAKANAKEVMNMAQKIEKNHNIVVVKTPNKTLTMVKMREPVKNTLFYIGEVMVTEVIVELDGVKAVAVTMGDDIEKTYNMAVIDAAYNAGCFTDEKILIDMEQKQNQLAMKENAMHMKTKVNFNSMDSEVVQN